MINQAGNFSVRFRTGKYTVREFAEPLTDYAFCRADLFSDEDLMGVPVQGLNSKVCRSIRHNWPVRKSIIIKAFTEYATAIDTTAESRNLTENRAISLAMTKPYRCRCSVVRRQQWIFCWPHMKWARALEARARRSSALQVV